HSHTRQPSPRLTLDAAGTRNGSPSEHRPNSRPDNRVNLYDLTFKHLQPHSLSRMLSLPGEELRPLVYPDYVLFLWQ
ncbi:MAG TPA: hypothetical protein PLT48_19800, partial [Nitrospira sp.]|nr:hypothetical protein [Nitrospira sp.]